MRLTQQAQLDALPTGSRVLWVNTGKPHVCTKFPACELLNSEGEKVAIPDGLWAVPRGVGLDLVTSESLANLQLWLVEATATTTDDLDRLLGGAVWRDKHGTLIEKVSPVIPNRASDLPAAILWPGEA